MKVREIKGTECGTTQGKNWTKWGARNEYFNGVVESGGAAGREWTKKGVARGKVNARSWERKHTKNRSSQDGKQCRVLEAEAGFLIMTKSKED